MKEIELSKGYVALIDDEDFELVNQYSWHASFSHNKVYASTRMSMMNGRRNILFMHRLIMNAPSHLEVDHKDGDSLNNTRSNLRLATHAQNQMNIRKKKGMTSQFKGVHKLQDLNKWCARIKFNQISISLGRFTSEIEAAKAYDLKARELFGEFANTNFSLSAPKP